MLIYAGIVAGLRARAVGRKLISNHLERGDESSAAHVRVAENIASKRITCGW